MGDKKITDWSSQISGRANASYGGDFSVLYASLHRYVRRPGIESDMDMLAPMDVHADQTELMQILQKGHHNVKLKPEELEKLACWIDLNTPFHGRRSDIVTYHRTEESRRLRAIYAQLFDVKEPDLEYLPEKPQDIVSEMPEEKQYNTGIDSLVDWPVQRGVIENRQINLGQYPVLCTDQIAQKIIIDHQHFKIINFVFWVMRSYFRACLLEETRIGVVQ